MVFNVSFFLNVFYNFMITSKNQHQFLNTNSVLGIM